MMCEAPPQTRRSSREKVREFCDGKDFPVMIELSGGTFIMGENEGDKFANDTERPAHLVKMRSSFAIGKFPITVAEFAKFQPLHSFEDEPHLPVVRVTWHRAVAYCDWLTRKTGRHYRLPSEAEWEFACRAGSRTPFHTGNEISLDDANFFYDESGTRIGPGHRMPVGNFPPNEFGLHDMHGNVCEWVADSWHSNYLTAPADGSAWLANDETRCVIRGGAWDYLPRLLRSSWRDWRFAGQRADNIGFRVAADISAHLHLE